MKNVMDDRTYFLKSNHELWDVTLDEFARKSFESASLNEILKRSGFNKGSFYYRFSEKKDLYTALIADLYTQHSMLLDDSFQTLKFTSNLRDATAVILSSCVALAAIDRRYLDLYDSNFHEPEALRDEIRQSCGASPIEQHLKDAAIRLESDPEIAKVDADVFNRLGRLIFHSFGKMLSADGSMPAVSRLADTVITGCFSKKTVDHRTILKMEEDDFSIESDRSLLPETAFSLLEGEIVAFVGNRDARNRTLMAELGGKINASLRPVSYFTDQLISRKEKDREGNLAIVPSPIRWRSTPRQMLKRRSPDISPEQVFAWLDLLGLTEVADIRFDRLTDAARIKTDLLRMIASGHKTILLDDVLALLHETDKQRIYRLLLKCKHNGNTIVLSTSRMDEALEVADRVFFLSQGRVVKIENVTDLQQKYGQPSILVEYEENGIIRQALFSAGSLAEPRFRNLVETKTIVKIETVKNIGNEIFRKETGVRLQ